MISFNWGGWEEQEQEEEEEEEEQEQEEEEGEEEEDGALGQRTSHWPQG